MGDPKKGGFPPVQPKVNYVTIKTARLKTRLLRGAIPWFG